MKKLLMICIMGLLAAFPLFAKEKKEVSLRFSQHDNSVRVVLESDDSSIRNAIIIATLSSIKIEFPEPVELKKQSDFVFEASATDHILSIKLKNAEDISFYKLVGPSRIVIDLKIAQKLLDNQQAQTREKPKQETVNVAEKTAASRVIFFDPGHGGYDYGLIYKDTKEKDLNLLFTKDLSEALSKKMNKVFLTRKVDQSLSILDRVLLVNSKKPDVFISIHSSVSNAFVVYTAALDEQANEASFRQYGLMGRQSRHIEKSRVLAKAIGKSLKGEFKGDVIERELPLPLLNAMNSTAVLIEYPSMQLNTYDQKMRSRLVNAIMKGILSYE